MAPPAGHPARCSPPPTPASERVRLGPQQVFFFTQPSLTPRGCPQHLPSPISPRADHPHSLWPLPPLTGTASTHSCPQPGQEAQSPSAPQSTREGGLLRGGEGAPEGPPWVGHPTQGRTHGDGCAHMPVLPGHEHPGSELLPAPRLPRVLWAHVSCILSGSQSGGPSRPPGHSGNSLQGDN